jgi:hypothetical protein
MGKKPIFGKSACALKNAKINTATFSSNKEKRCFFRGRERKED